MYKEASAMFDCWGAFIEGSNFSRDKFDLNTQGNSYLGSKPTQLIRSSKVRNDWSPNTSEKAEYRVDENSDMDSKKECGGRRAYGK